MHFHDPEVPVVSNIDAAAKTTGSASQQALIEQVTGAVQWSRCVQKLVEFGATTFIEVGPGKVLTGLMRQIDRSQTALPVNNEASLQNVTNLFESAQSSSA